MLLTVPGQLVPNRDLEITLAGWVQVTVSGPQPHCLCLISLISTDATARGIDVQGVELVINYDAPQYLRTYVHR